MTGGAGRPRGDLYHRAIVEAARRATGAGRLEDADAKVTVDNPLCGDRVSIDVRMAGGRVEACAHRVRGCLLCEAAASVIGENAVGETGERLESVRSALAEHLAGGEGAEPAWRDLEMFDPVRDYRSRHECVLLPFEALLRAVAEASGGEA